MFLRGLFSCAWLKPSSGMDCACDRFLLIIFSQLDSQFSSLFTLSKLTHKNTIKNDNFCCSDVSFTSNFLLWMSISSLCIENHLDEQFSWKLTSWQNHYGNNSLPFLHKLWFIERRRWKTVSQLRLSKNKDTNERFWVVCQQWQLNICAIETEKKNDNRPHFNRNEMEMVST